MRLALEDPDLDYQLQRTLAKADFGMANAGECLRIGSELTSGDPADWHRTFSEFAARLRRRADAERKSGHEVSARSAYLRACEYFRNAFFYLRDDLDDERLQSAFRASRDCYRAAAEHAPHPLEPVELEIEGDRCGGYLGLPTGAGPFPAVIAPGGYDSTAEELHPTLLAGVGRGYAVLTFDGPGQGGTLYQERIPMRPDWESVIEPVFDWICEREAIDSGRVALLGRSFGGYLCPRAAAGERRVAALITDPGQYDLGEGLRKRLPPGLAARIGEDSAEARSAFEALLEGEGGRRLFGPRMAAHGTDSVQEYCRMMLEYSNAGRASSIECPTLICDNDSDAISTSQGKQLYDALACPKDFIQFTAAEGAEGHCEGMGAIVFYERAFDWLDSAM